MKPKILHGFITIIKFNQPPFQLIHLDFSFYRYVAAIDKPLVIYDISFIFLIKKMTQNSSFQVLKEQQGARREREAQRIR